MHVKMRENSHQTVETKEVEIDGFFRGPEVFPTPDTFVVRVIHGSDVFELVVDKENIRDFQRLMTGSCACEECHHHRVHLHTPNSEWFVGAK